MPLYLFYLLGIARQSLVWPKQLHYLRQAATVELGSLRAKLELLQLMVDLKPTEAPNGKAKIAEQQSLLSEDAYEREFTAWQKLAQAQFEFFISNCSSEICGMGSFLFKQLLPQSSKVNDSFIDYVLNKDRADVGNPRTRLGRLYQKEKSGLDFCSSVHASDPHTPVASSRPLQPASDAKSLGISGSNSESGLARAMNFGINAPSQCPIVCGLFNMGNTCFAGSIKQSVLGLETMHAWLLHLSTKVSYYKCFVFLDLFISQHS